MARIDGKISLLQRSDFFGRCTRQELDLVSRAVDCLDVFPDELIAARDDPTGVFVVVLDGALAAVDGDNRRRVLHSGDAWGAEALLTRVRNDENLTAVKPSKVAIAGPRAFASLHMAAPGFAKAISTQLAKELVTSRAPRLRPVALHGLPALG